MSYSYDICKVACPCIDDNGHFKTNKISAPGESGAPIFDLYTGSLLGMMTGSEAYREVNAAGYGGKGCFVSSLYLKRDMYIEEKIENESI